MRQHETQIDNRFSPGPEPIPYERRIRNDGARSTGLTPEQTCKLKYGLVVQREAIAVFDRRNAGGALVLEVSKELHVVQVPETVQVFDAACDGWGDGAWG